MLVSKRLNFEDEESTIRLCWKKLADLGRGSLRRQSRQSSMKFISRDFLLELKIGSAEDISRGEISFQGHGKDFFPRWKATFRLKATREIENLKTFIRKPVEKEGRCFPCSRKKKFVFCC